MGIEEILLIAGAAGDVANDSSNWFEPSWVKQSRFDSYNLNSPEWLWKKQQLELERQREDNAVQRRAKDMVNAGINPVLAAGNGAASSASGLSVSAAAPTQTRPQYEKLQSMLALSQAYEQMKLQQAQVQLTKEEQKSKNLDNKIKPIVAAKELVNLENAKKDGAYKDLENVSKAMDNEYKGWDYQKSYDTGISKDTHPLAKVIRDESALLQQYVQGINQGIKNGSIKVKQGFKNLIDKYSGNYGYQPSVYDVQKYQRH